MMKWHSPIFLLFFFLTSCHWGKKKNTLETPVTIIENIDKAYRSSSKDSAMIFLNQAEKLSMNTHNDTIIYNTLGSKINFLISQKPDSLPVPLRKLWKVIKRLDTRASTAFYQSRLGDYYLYIHHYDSAYYNYNASIKLISNPKQDTLTTVYNLIKIASIEQIYDDYNSAQSTAIEALELLDEKDKVMEKELYNTLAISFSGIKDYDSAIEYYMKALYITKDSLSQKIITNNIAYTYLEDGKYQNATNLLRKLRKSPVVNNNPYTKAMVLDNLGYALFKQGNREGVSLIKNAIDIMEKENDLENLPLGYLHYAETVSPDNLNLKLSLVKKAYEFASLSNSIDKRLESLQKLAIISKGEQKILYTNVFFHLNDSIDEVRHKATNQFAKWKYDVSEIKRQNADYEAQRQANDLKQHATRMVYFSSLAIVIGIILIIYMAIRAKHIKEKQREAYKTETRIAKKVHDELANDVYRTITFAETKDLASNENKEVLLDHLDSIYTRSRNISRENSSIATGKDFKEELRQLLSSYNSDTITVYQNGIDSIHWEDMIDYKQMTVYRVIQEILTNMKKHSQCNRAMFLFEENADHICISYHDDGIGKAENIKKEHGGLQNVENRIQGINGTVTFENAPEKGFRIRFTVPFKKSI